MSHMCLNDDDDDGKDDGDDNDDDDNNNDKVLIADCTEKLCCVVPICVKLQWACCHED